MLANPRPASFEEKVSVVIPTRGDSPQGGVDPIWLKTVETILKYTNYPHFEIILVSDSDITEPLSRMKHLPSFEQVKVISWGKPFNFSAKMNWGSINSDGKYLLLLNDDIEVSDPEWISKLVKTMAATGAGLVGASLFFPDGRIQHAGQTIAQGAPTHIGRGRFPEEFDDVLLQTDWEVLGVTAACALIERSLYIRVGGFSTLFPVNFNDVDLCMKVRMLGRSVFLSGGTHLIHHESFTRESHVHFHELDLLESRWGVRNFVDQYWPQ